VPQTKIKTHTAPAKKAFADLFDLATLSLAIGMLSFRLTDPNHKYGRNRAWVFLFKIGLSKAGVKNDLPQLNRGRTLPSYEFHDGKGAMTPSTTR